MTIQAKPVVDKVVNCQEGANVCSHVKDFYYEVCNDNPPRFESWMSEDVEEMIDYSFNIWFVFFQGVFEVNQIPIDSAMEDIGDIIRNDKCCYEKWHPMILLKKRDTRFKKRLS